MRIRIGPIKIYIYIVIHLSMNTIDCSSAFSIFIDSLKFEIFDFEYFGNVRNNMINCRYFNIHLWMI